MIPWLDRIVVILDTFRTPYRSEDELELLEAEVMTIRKAPIPTTKQLTR
jgi:hypothetical protein